MHDFSVQYPRCTNSSSQGESDCGSIAWAFTLFIAWNLLSMYIFVNMFTGVVVENFSYVFQTSAGGAKAITREEMRAFKKVWAEFANPKTEHLERANFGPFFSKLSGAFEVRIYPPEFHIKNVVATCKERSSSVGMPPAMNDAGVDLLKLTKVLDKIDYASIRKRRAIYTRLYHEAILSDQEGRGISFTSMLFLLAHHKLIVDRDALVFKDLVARTEKAKFVTDCVNLDRVQSLLKTISHRRRFLMHGELVRAQEIPSIIVESMPSTPPWLNNEIPSESSSPNGSPSPSSGRFSVADVSLAVDGSGLHRSSRRTSDLSVVSDSFRSPRASLAEEDPQKVLSSMEQSVWGDMMMEATQEEEQ